ncbi:thiamine pyrophosphate-dependent dehydrogenase E1 component subunit alpha [Paenarthrobacter sp. 2TAF44]|uniref:thiamine pyrophosphate-dependent dehydrogenase E1 component subunit alpha n=1 Tax=Paenarthrobacter sp. 2TAF44 TaxID=3233018 RepID=UPI003F9789F6
MSFDHGTPEGRMNLWRAMVRGRAFDQAMCRHNNHWHEARGEEAVFIGGFAQLEADDIVAPHFRGACAVSLMRGSDPAELAAGVFGTDGSNSGGNWRGDICPTPSERFIGMFSGSLGTTVAYATGAALHLQQRHLNNVAVCAFGDGTANAGIVAESMNLASMLQLPLVLICQNNQYATSLPATTAIAGGTVSDRAKALGLEVVDVDGNDLEAVISARATAVARAREGGGPTLIHALTYRMGGHYMNDPETYRTRDEVAAWEKLDPITRFEQKLIVAGELGADEAASETLSLMAEMNDIVAAAKDAPPTENLVLNPSAYAEDWRIAS